MHQPLAIAVIGGFVIALPLLLIIFPTLLNLIYRHEDKGTGQGNSLKIQDLCRNGLQSVSYNIFIKFYYRSICLVDHSLRIETFQDSFSGFYPHFQSGLTVLNAF